MSQLEVQAVAGKKSGFVIAGQNRSGSPAWFSTDGRTWRPAVGLDGSVVGVAIVEDQFVAVGASGGQAAAWVSPLGDRWTKTSLADSAPVSAMTATSSGIVAVTSYVRWSTDISGTGEARVWKSTDGVRWSQVDGKGLGHAFIVSLGGVTGGLISLGVQNSKPLIWSSPTGANWARDDSSDDLHGVPPLVSNGRIVLIAVDGSTLICSGIGST